MYFNWKALLSFGFAFWSLLCYTDLLGESSWKRCSNHIESMLMDQMHQMSEEPEPEAFDKSTEKMQWPSFLWNVCAFLCSLIFCSILKSMSWGLWKLLKIYNMIKNKHFFAHAVRGTNNTKTEDVGVIFKNQLFAGNLQQTEPSLSKDLEELKKQKDNLIQQLKLTQKENVLARQQIEEYKLETLMMKEKLTKTAITLKENYMYKDFITGNQEIFAKKIQTLEMHLKDVCKDRDDLRHKLESLEETNSCLRQKLDRYDLKSNSEQYPEKDTSKNDQVAELDICNFRKKIIELQRNIDTYKDKKNYFEANSKISLDCEESTNASKENVSESTSQTNKKSLNVIKQNILNYNAYKAQMMRPKVKLSDTKIRLFHPVSDTGSSSDDNSGPQRIISSTAEFQNFLKTLTSESN